MLSFFFILLLFFSILQEIFILARIKNFNKNNTLFNFAKKYIQAF